MAHDSTRLCPLTHRPSSRRSWTSPHSTICPEYRSNICCEETHLSLISDTVSQIKSDCSGCVENAKVAICAAVCSPSALTEVTPSIGHVSSPAFNLKLPAVFCAAAQLSCNATAQCLPGSTIQTAIQTAVDKILAITPKPAASYWVAGDAKPLGPIPVNIQVTDPEEWQRHFVAPVAANCGEPTGFKTVAGTAVNFPINEEGEVSKPAGINKRIVWLIAIGLLFVWACLKTPVVKRGGRISSEEDEEQPWIKVDYPSSAARTKI